MLNFGNKYHSTDNPGRFREENQMGRKFSLWYSRKFGYTSRGCPINFLEISKIAVTFVTDNFSKCKLKFFGQKKRALVFVLAVQSAFLNSTMSCFKLFLEFSNKEEITSAFIGFWFYKAVSWCFRVYKVSKQLVWSLHQFQKDWELLTFSLLPFEFVCIPISITSPACGVFSFPRKVTNPFPTK